MEVFSIFSSTNQDRPESYLARRTTFSAGMVLLHPGWSQERNQEVFGRSVGPHGQDFIVEIFLSGPISTTDGMIVNIAELKPVLSLATASLDGRFLNQDVEFFRLHCPTAENVAHFIWSQLPATVGDGELHRLKLEQSRRTSVEITSSSMKVSRFYEFAAAHRLFSPDLSETENWERFDKCSNRAGHGHNFQLEVAIEGVPDEESGFIINPSLLDHIVETEVYQRFDHKHLNKDCPEFATLIPSSENLALVIFDLLQRNLSSRGYKLARVGLRETQKNYFEVEA